MRDAGGEGALSKRRGYVRHDERWVLHGEHVVCAVRNGNVFVVYPAKGATPTKLTVESLEISGWEVSGVRIEER
jgi:hypothetical protein